jgi:hypothetical protein
VSDERVQCVVIGAPSPPSHAYRTELLREGFARTRETFRRMHEQMAKVAEAIAKVTSP